MHKYLTSQALRERFLQFFRSHQHEIVASSSLVPINDPTLLFTNAGMVQFKDVFLGKEEKPYKRAASAQRCVRAGGKHNDLERVGYTARHHTFFEMLGNFSFGDYFKHQAIHFAWDFLTQDLQIPVEKLWVTVYNEDKEAEEIWLRDIKINPERFSRLREEDNFWAMGPTGPCGPCTEIFYDHGETVPGGPPGTAEGDSDRYVEIWNLVFMQFNRMHDGNLNPLPKPSVDTGMGLERIAAVMQGVHNNYDTDLFLPLIDAAAKIAHIKDKSNFSLRVIADHIRSCSFLIADGVLPSNEGRGYVLRRIIRRAVRHGHQLGITKPFFYRLVQPLKKIMGEAYPELIEKQQQIEKILHQEEEQFQLTLNQGLKLFEQVIGDLKSKILPGEIVFKLYDTYGFPADLTADIAREKNLIVDLEGFEMEMSKQRERSRKASTFTADYELSAIKQDATRFVGHKNLLTNQTTDIGKILAIYQSGKFVERLEAGQKGSIILDQTPFYAESGGQVGDKGLLIADQAQFDVTDTIKQARTYIHLGKMERGSLHVGDEVIAKVNAERRAAIVLNHTATHLLHHVLKQTLGEHAIQKGSLVEPERLRFDFSHPAPLTEDELDLIEKRVNALIRQNQQANVRVTTPDEAIASGAIALFGEKYGKEVRVVSFGQSVELCGGTHADATGEVGLFKITGESGVAAGIRRIEAVTGEAALQFIAKREDTYRHKLKEAEDKIHRLEKELSQLKDQLASSFCNEIAQRAKNVAGIKVLATKVEGLDGKALRLAVDQLKNKLQTAVIVLATIKGDKIGIVGGVTSNLTAKMSARELVAMVTAKVGGRGGGREELAEGGGNKPELLEDALQSIYTWVQERTV